MKLIHVDPNDLSPNSWNTNVVSAGNEEKLKQSLDVLGFFRPIVARQKKSGSLEVLAGEHRRQIAIESGIKKVPVIDLGKIDDVKAKKISIADNARYGEDDDRKLAALIEDLGIDADLPSILPVTEDEIASVMAGVELDLDSLDLEDEDEEEDEEESDSKPERKVLTHETIKFRVPIEDASKVREIIDKAAIEQGFDDPDQNAAMNAGDALVFLLMGKSSTNEE